MSVEILLHQGNGYYNFWLLDMRLSSTCVDPMKFNIPVANHELAGIEKILLCHAAHNIDSYFKIICLLFGTICKGSRIYELIFLPFERTNVFDFFVTSIIHFYLLFPFILVKKNI